MLIGQVLVHAGERARALGVGRVGPEVLLLGVVKDVQTPWPRCMNNRWRRQLHASVGLPEDYEGVAGPLLAALGVGVSLAIQAATAATTVRLSAGLGPRLLPGRLPSRDSP